MMRTLALVVLMAGLNASGQAPQPFDVAAAGGEHAACGIGVPFFEPYIEFLGISVEPDTDIDFIAAGGDGRVLALVGTRIVEIRPDLTRTPVFSGIDGVFGHGFVVDAAGNMYLSTAQGRFFAIRPDGTIRTEFALNPAFMDLAADQCTLFYSSQSGAPGIHRFNVCSGAPLPDFLPGVDVGGIKILPDGGLLRLPDLILPAPGEDSRVFRYDAAGTLVRTYPVLEDGVSLALGRAGHSMFVGSDCFGEGIVREYDLATGTLLRSISFEFNHPRTIVANDGFTAALGPLAAAAVPSLSTTMLVVLGALLALLAVRRL
jgi:hypothetical protein